MSEQPSRDFCSVSRAIPNKEPCSAGGIGVRRAVPADAAAVRALGIAFTPGAAHVPDDAFSSRFAEIVADDASCLLVAEGVAGVLGYAFAQDFGRGLRATFTTGRLHDLVVDPDARGRGIGRALMDAVAGWARSRPDPMILDWQASADAVDFYVALGFEPDRVGDFPDHPGFCLDTRG